MADAMREAGLVALRVFLRLAPMLLLAGCVTPPQTPDELRAGVRAGAMMTQMKTVEIDRSVSAVFKSLRANADKCLNVTIVGSTPGTYGPVVESTTYRSTSRMVNKGTGETVLQQDARATGRMPPGGYYVLVADTEALSGQKSRVTIYGASVGYDDVFEAIMTWAKGRPHECPAIAGPRMGRDYRYHNR
jgi:hypothetical protein